MYLGGSLSFIGITIARGSFLGFLTVWIWVLLIAICGWLEEVKLRKDLPNDQYEEYARSTWI
jgi:protein-S-isoprenylcysteine O-methyltransferase Ste14